MTRLGDGLALLLVHLGYAKRHPAALAMVCWRQAAGETVARHAAPEAAQGSTLCLVVDSAVWAQELRYLEAGLIRRLNERVGRPCVEALRYRIGRLPDGEHWEPRIGPQSGHAFRGGETDRSEDVGEAWEKVLRALAERERREGGAPPPGRGAGPVAEGGTG